jgi:hypothetical protein
MKQHTFRLLALAFLVAGLSLSPLAVDKADASGYLCDYYSDYTMTTLVGQHGTDCCGDPVHWGQTTKFYQCYAINCVWCPPES